MLGNPPWERIKIQEKEWFAERRPEIAAATNAASRAKLIKELVDEDPALLEAFHNDNRRAEGESQFVRESSRFPLCGRGDVNTYSIFTETNRLILGPTGQVGCIVPSGIATDDTTKFFFRDLIEGKNLASLFDFENREKLFPDVDSRMKFCLLTITNNLKFASTGADFVFFALKMEDINNLDKRFKLSAEDIALLNPDSRTCPVFCSRRDAELTKSIYYRIPIFIKEGFVNQNAWKILLSRMFHMADDSHLFRTLKQIEKQKPLLEGNIFFYEDKKYYPLYEAKMLHHYDHRWATYEELETRSLTLKEKVDPNKFVMPRYWVREEDLRNMLSNKCEREWLIGWRDICRSTDERTVIFSILPKAGVGNTYPLMFILSVEIFLLGCLQANLTSFVLDFCARQKIGGTHLTYGYLHSQFFHLLYILSQLPGILYSSFKIGYLIVFLNLLTPHGILSHLHAIVAMMGRLSNGMMNDVF